jgi:hypothetical protein
VAGGDCDGRGGGTWSPNIFLGSHAKGGLGGRATVALLEMSDIQVDMADDGDGDDDGSDDDGMGGCISDSHPTVYQTTFMGVCSSD